MRIFSLDHPDKVRALPAHFADWAIRFDGVERAAEAEIEAKRWGG